jgi:hypothetical protein
MRISPFTRSKLPETKRRIGAVLVAVVSLLSWSCVLRLFLDDEPNLYLSSLLSSLTIANSEMPQRHQDNIRRRPCNLPLPVSVVSGIFYPKRFFEEGSGRQYLGFYKNMVENNFRTAVKHPRFITIEHSAKETTSATCKAIFYHIHKCGGSTAIKVMKHSQAVQSTNYDTYVEKNMGADLFEEQARSVFMDAYKQQVDEGDDPNKPYLPIFTFVRDPLVRFLSGLSQFIEFRDRTNPLYECFTREKETVPMVECVVKLMHVHQSYLDIHLQPQAYELYKALYGNDLAFQLINLQDLPSTFSSLGVADTPIGTERARKQRTGRFNLTSVAILTKELKAEICELYKMDVIMLRESAIMEHTACDDDDE